MYFLRPVSHWSFSNAVDSIVGRPPFILGYPWHPSPQRQQIDYSEVRDGPGSSAAQFKRPKVPRLETGSRKTARLSSGSKSDSECTGSRERKHGPPRTEDLDTKNTVTASVGIAYAVRRKIRCKPIPPWRWYEDRKTIASERLNAHASNTVDHERNTSAQTPVSHTHDVKY